MDRLDRLYLESQGKDVKNIQASMGIGSLVGAGVIIATSQASGVSVDPTSADIIAAASAGAAAGGGLAYLKEIANEYSPFAMIKKAGAASLIKKDKRYLALDADLKKAGENIAKFIDEFSEFSNSVNDPSGDKILKPILTAIAYEYFSIQTLARDKMYVVSEKGDGYFQDKIELDNRKINELTSAFVSTLSDKDSFEKAMSALKDDIKASKDEAIANYVKEGSLRASGENSVKEIYRKMVELGFDKSMNEIVNSALNVLDSCKDKVNDPKFSRIFAEKFHNELMYGDKDFDATSIGYDMAINFYDRHKNAKYTEITGSIDFIKPMIAILKQIDDEWLRSQTLKFNFSEGMLNRETIDFVYELNKEKYKVNDITSPTVTRPVGYDQQRLNKDASLVEIYCDSKTFGTETSFTAYAIDHKSATFETISDDDRYDTFKSIYDQGVLAGRKERNYDISGL